MTVLHASMCSRSVCGSQVHHSRLNAIKRLDQPVVRTILGAVAYDQHAVVEFGATGLAQDTTLVQLEGHLVSLLTSWLVSCDSPVRTLRMYYTV